MAATNVATMLPANPAQRQIDIDFLFLDRETCSRCAGSEANLDAALDDVSRILASAGVVASVQKTLVASAEQARSLGFVSSPTIRVNGQDIALQLRESACDDCGALAGTSDIDCRVWVWQDAEYEEAPAAMVVDAVLRAVYGNSPRPTAAEQDVAADVPENLQRFFAGVALPKASGCCSASEQQSCCEPSAKASCCGEASTSGGGCGCR